MSEGLDIREIRPLDLLDIAAKHHHATVCLTSSADIRERTSGRKASNLEEGAQLRLLAVVRPAAAAGNRWRRLARGTTLVSAPVDNALNLDEVALHLANQLHTLSRRQAA